MNAEEITEELFDIMCNENYVEEPAGCGCGYGFTEDGQAEVLAVIKRIMPQTRKEENIMSTGTVVEQVVFEVTVVERTEVLCEGSGVLKKINRKKHLWREPVVAVNEKTAESKAIRKLTKKMDDAEAEAFIDRLKVTVTAPFPG